MIGPIDLFDGARQPSIQSLLKATPNKDSEHLAISWLQMPWNVQKAQLFQVTTETWISSNQVARDYTIISIQTGGVAGS